MFEDAFGVTDHIEAVIKAAQQIHAELGFGFESAIYRKALHKLLKEAELPIQVRKEYPVMFQGKEVGKYTAGMVLRNLVLIQVVTFPFLKPTDILPAQNRINATGIQIALVLNFGLTKLEVRRLRVVYPPSS
ncbi:MAG: GxxExxY protein [Verrucomicrobiae bacterium]|nr:GxxExxY protein [Verrucomicrobiae bacterium]